MAVLTQDQFDVTILNLVNQERSSQGLNPLIMSERLDAAADLHSNQMLQQDFYAHINPVTGSTIGTRTMDQNYQSPNSGWSIGENIAAGQGTPTIVMNSWMNSAGHRANILNPNFTHFGFGYAASENDTGNVNFNQYWTQVFGSGGVAGTYQPQMTSNPPNSGPIEGTGARDLLVGTSGMDTINGNGGNDSIRGLEGNDVLKGGGGNDLLIGVNPNASNALVGKNEKDTLVGNTGADTFVLGQNGKVFYDDGIVASSGTVDYGLIRGFNLGQGDRIQLEGSPSDYVLGQSGSGLPQGTKIYVKTSGENELIGIIQNVTITSTSNSAFRYV